MIDTISGTVDCCYLRPAKAEKMRMLNEQGISKLDNLKIQTIKNGVILPVKRDKKLLFGYGGVVNESKQYCELSGICGRVWGGYDFEEPEFLDKKVVFCGYAVKHWGHFLIEAVNRLWYYLENDDSSIDYYVFIIDINEEREIRENYLEFLQLLGIEHRIKLINKPTRFREIIIPQNSFVYNQYYSDNYLRIFETVRQNALLGSSVCEGGRLFFSRGNFQKAKETEIGLDMLDNFFENNGFTVLYPEKLSLKK